MGKVAVLALALVGCGGAGAGDDVPPGTPTVGFDMAASSYDETDGQFTINFTLSEPSDDVVTFFVDIGGTAENGSDYFGGGSGIALIPPHAPFTWVTLTLLDDGEPEPAETIELSLSACSGCRIGQGEHTITIRDNLASRLTFAHASHANDEGMPGSVEIQIIPPSPVPMTVDYTLTGTASEGDYTVRSGTLAIPAGVDVFPLELGQIDDDLDEDNETIVIELSNPTDAILGIQPSVTHTILDDDATVRARFVTADATVTEGNSGMQMVTAEIQLDAISGRTVTVAFGPGSSQFFTATPGVDFSFVTPSPVVFPAGTTSQTITVAIHGDTVQDGSDRVGIALTGGMNVQLGTDDYFIVQVDNDECLAAGAYAVCPDTAPTTDLALDSLTFRNTSFNGGMCADRQPPGWIAAGQPDACFIVANNITIGTARFEGFRPVVLVALGSITVNTLLDAGSHFNGAVGIEGPGHNPAVCAPFVTANPAAGGAGGSFSTAGGNGGDHGPSEPGGVAAAPTTANVLRGGCSGGVSLLGEQGSAGGGAVYLLAGTSITLASNAVVNVSGASGSGGFLRGGNGGGSGGMIVLWSSSIAATGARLLANGGGGGEGYDGNQRGDDGSDADYTMPLTPAAGGSGTAGGDGGAGAVQGIAAQPGSDATSNRHAGGGGGGLGYIFAHPALSGATSSPSATTL